MRAKAFGRLVAGNMVGDAERDSVMAEINDAVEHDNGGRIVGKAKSDVRVRRGEVFVRASVVILR